MHSKNHRIHDMVLADDGPNENVNLSGYLEHVPHCGSRTFLLRKSGDFVLMLPLPKMLFRVPVV